MYNQLDVVKLLLEHGADPNIGDNVGIRPLAHIFLKNHKDREKIIRLLLEYGADPSIQDKLGKNAFDFVDICKTMSYKATPEEIELLEAANLKLHGIRRGSK